MSVTKASLFASQMQTEACRIQTKMVHLYGGELLTKTHTKYHHLAPLPTNWWRTPCLEIILNWPILMFLIGWNFGTEDFGPHNLTRGGKYGKNEREGVEVYQSSRRRIKHRVKLEAERLQVLSRCRGSQIIVRSDV